MQTMARPTPPGGPSTIQGILYQMAWCLLRTLRLHISDVLRSTTTNVITQAHLILEPPDGGDAIVQSGPQRQVVQFKTRSGDATWSLKDVIVDVFPDLYRAVDVADTSTRYVFVTDGRVGRWKDAQAFFGRLSLQQHGISKLDDSASLYEPRSGAAVALAAGAISGASPPQPFWTKGVYTEQGLFDRVVEYLRSVPAGKDDDVDTAARKVWQLLSRFDVVENQGLLAVEKEVDLLLSQLVSHQEQIPEKRDALLMRVMNMAVAGGAYLQPKEILAELGLDVTPICQEATLRAMAHGVLQGALRAFQYDQGQDVRVTDAAELASTWSTPFLVVSGESGSGKTWRLLALANAVAAADGFVLVMRSGASGILADLSNAANDFWQRIRGHGDNKSLASVAADIKRQRGDRRWLSVFIDGVHDVEQANILARQPLEDLGVRVALSASDDVAACLVQAARARATSVRVEPFSDAQRNEYLQRRLGEQWATLPVDVLDTLRRPLLADLYCTDITTDGSWQPHDEYALYDRFWDRLVRGAHVPQAKDRVRLAKLALGILENQVYPWPVAALEVADMADDGLRRLIRAGWLRDAERDRFEIPHDRLLNFAVAHGIVDALLVERMDLPSVAKLMVTLLTEFKTFSGRRLAYVPMDVFHLLSEQQDGRGLCGRLLMLLEQQRTVRHESLFQSLVTLGPRILPIMFDRLKVACAEHNDIRKWEISDAISAFEAPQIADEVCRLLNNGTADERTAVLRVLRKRPIATALDGVWKLHHDMQERPELFWHGDRDGAPFLYDDSMRTLRACVALDIRWLEDALMREDPARGRLHDLAYLLASHPDGAETWRRCKSLLLAAIPDAKARCLAVNIGRYRDVEEVGRLVAWSAQEKDLLGPTAVRALARIDPVEAVKRLVALSERDLYMKRSWHVPLLRELVPDVLDAALLKAVRSANDPWDVAFVFQGAEDTVPVAILDATLDALSAQLQWLKENPSAENQVPLFRSLLCLAEISRPELLDCFSRRANSDLGERLKDYLIRARPTGADYKEGMSVLERVDPDRYADVVAAHLKTTVVPEIYAVLPLAGRTSHPSVAGELLRICVESHNRPNTAEGCLAFRALGSTGSPKLVEAICKVGLACPSDLNAYVRSGVITAEDVAPALEQLQSDNSVATAAAVLALSLCSWSAATSEVLALLAKVPSDSDVALACVHFLWQVGPQSSDAIEVLLRQLRVPRTAGYAFAALMRTATSSAALAQHLRQAFEFERAAAVIETLPDASLVDMLAESVERAAHRLDERLAQLVRLPDDVVVRILRSDDVRARIAAAALDYDAGFVVGAQARAVRALSTWNPALAVLATEKVLRNAKAHDRVRYPGLLMRLDAARGTEFLAERVVVEQSSVLCHAMGRALATAGAGPRIRALLSSVLRERRLAGCVLGGFCEDDAGIEALLRTLILDMDGEVAAEALAALERRRRRRDEVQLKTRILATRDRHQRWLSIDGLLRVGDLGDEGTLPRWLRELEAVLDADMWEHAVEKVKKLRKKRDEDMDRNDRRDW